MHLACCIIIIPLQCWWRRSKVMEVNESPALMIDTSMRIYISHPNSFFFARFTSIILCQTCQLSVCLGFAAVPHNQWLLSCCVSVFKILSQAVFGYPDRLEYFPNLLNFSYIHPAKSPRKCTGTASRMLIGRTFCLPDSTDLAHVTTLWRQN